MKDFRLFDITDFVMDEDFIRWVQCRKPEDNAFWNNWLNRHPEKHLIIAEARRILESIRIEQKEISDYEIQSETERLLQTIKGHTLPQTKKPAKTFSISRRLKYIAAAVTVFLVAGISFFLPGSKRTPGKFAYAVITSTKQLVEQVNTSDKPIAVTMPDGSLIELAVNSRISFPSKFDSGTRDVYLSGEGYFKVVRDPSRPFRVFANEIVTKVLGTSFIVRSFDKDSTIQVLVKTGKVSVYSQDGAGGSKEIADAGKSGGVILTPNQQLIYDKQGQKFQRVLQKNPVMIVQDVIDKNMLYEDHSVIEVFDQLSKAYGINIVYDSEILKNCTVTADLRSESFYTRLDLICRAVGAKYELIDGQVVIQSNGCQ
jgi:ferric-dicitrate binding protein FerR (iron transport regulator)